MLSKAKQNNKTRLTENKKQKDQKCFKYDCKHVF